MKLRRLLLLGVLGAGLATWLARDRSGTVSMHPEDWRGPEAGESRRRYRSLSHAHHHARQLTSLLVPVTEVYLLRAISPAFREQIMIVTAMSNDCSP
ncbi:MAG: hypothetical protein V1748_03695 [Actinomycetota bacterium]